MSIFQVIRWKDLSNVRAAPCCGRKCLLVVVMASDADTLPCSTVSARTSGCLFLFSAHDLTLGYLRGLWCWARHSRGGANTICRYVCGRDADAKAESSGRKSTPGDSTGPLKQTHKAVCALKQTIVLKGDMLFHFIPPLLLWFWSPSEWRAPLLTFVCQANSNHKLPSWGAKPLRAF